MVSKSILKNVHSNAAPASARSQESRNHDIALHHANLIQAQKNAESLILASTEALLDLPSSLVTADPAHPSPQDATLVKNSLRPFQTSAYDALIEERNINKTCGYVLCPRPNRLQSTNAKYRIIYNRGKGSDALRVVEKTYLEKWCSDECGRRALYIKVQLNEEPAWMRDTTFGVGDLVLLDDGNTMEEQQLLQGMRDLGVEDREEDVIANMKALAIERGDGNALSRSFGLADVAVKEKVSDGRTPPLPPTSATNGGPAFGTIEGYLPKHHVPDSVPGDASDDEIDDNEHDEERDDDLIETI